MNTKNTSNGDFLEELQEIVRNNLKDPEFGVSMLAREVGMSRSNLHRKVNALAKISVSQFIRQERLKAGLKLLKQTSSTVSEIAYEVGFSNVSYFIKCFHDYYGYSPGQIGNRENEDLQEIKRSLIKIKPAYFIGLLAILVLVISAFIYSNLKEKRNLPKTVAILPPYYETSDASHLSVINGTVQNVIDNLNLIKDIERVAPWQSVIQYKKTTKTAPEIARELHVQYIVQPSIFSHNEDVQLKLTLIEGTEDNPIWTESFDIDVNDVTATYQEISKEIAQGINAQITPAEKERIEKPITTNGKALNYYNAGVEFMNLWQNNGNKENLENAITQFETTLEYDKECASAWAQLSNIYYILYSHYKSLKLNYDSVQFEIYKHNILDCANMAMLTDPILDKSLFAVALSSKVMGHYPTAIKYLEKALEYNPNFANAFAQFSSINFNQNITNPKSIEYVLKAVQNATPENDSLKMAVFHFWAARSLRNAGLYEEAFIQIEKSINLNPNSLNNYIEKSEILIFKKQNVDSAKIVLSDVLKRHPEYSNAKRYFFKDLFLNKEYEKAYAVFKNLYELNNNDDFKQNEPDYRYLQRFVVVLERLGLQDEYDLYKKVLDRSPNNRQHTKGQYFGSYELIRSYCINHEPEKAMQEMRNFSRHDYFLAQHIHMWEFSPVYDIIRENKEYQKEYQEILSEIKTKFEANREQIRKMIKEEGLLAERTNS